MQKQAKERGPCDLFIDNVGADYNLFFQTESSLATDGIYFMVAALLGLAFAGFMLKAKLLPGFLGGAKRKLVPFFADYNREQEYRQLAQRVAEKKLKVLIDSMSAFEDAKDEMKKMKSHRARGKIIVDVVGDRDGT